MEPWVNHEKSDVSDGEDFGCNIRRLHFNSPVSVSPWDLEASTVELRILTL